MTSAGSDQSREAALVGRPHGSSRALRWFAALFLLIASGLLAWLASDAIAARFPDRPRPPDLLFEVLPQIDLLRYGADAAIAAGLLLLLVHTLRTRRDDAPGLVAAFALFYALRAAIVVLTPLAIAHGDGQYFALLPLQQNGNFPSGHAGAALLCYLFVDPRVAPGLRRLLLALAWTEWIALVVSRSHYSVDVIGGLLLAYFVWREWTGGALLAPLARWFAAGARTEPPRAASAPSAHR